MCCLEAKAGEPWWINVPVEVGMVSFQSEKVAMEFLDRGITNTVMRQLYLVLKFRWEKADELLENGKVGTAVRK